MHRRMGDVWIPDRPITIKEVKASIEILEEEWILFGSIGDMIGLNKVVLTASMIIASFFAALRGEEVVRIDVGSMRKYWKESTNSNEHPHVPLMLAGRFKGETGDKVFCQPLAPKSKSGVDILLWFSRTLCLLEQQEVVAGPLFRAPVKKSDMTRKASIGDIDPLFHEILRKVQKRYPSLIPDEVDVEGEYSISRSGRRGATSEAQNVELPQSVIEANNRWRKHQRAKGLSPSMSMMERYSDAKASVPTLIRFSQSL